MKDNKWAMLCKLKAAAFDDPLWRWERKWDGCRMRMDISRGGSVRLAARSGADKTAQFPELCDQNPWVKWGACSLDGEVVSARGLGFQEFNQRRMNRTEDIGKTALELPAKFVAFDLLYIGNEDKRHRACSDRYELLREVMLGSDPARFATSFRYASGVELFEKAKTYGWEGVVGKRLDEPYLPNRRAWVKVKRWLEGTFRVVGWCPGRGKRSGLAGSFMLEDDRHDYVGYVGTGFGDAELRRLTALVKESGEPVYFRVKYVEVTNDGMLRFPVYMGLGGRQERHGENLGASD